MSKQTSSAKVSKRTPWTTTDGAKLKKARKNFGISQAQLGVIVGVTSSRICELERVDFPGGRHCSPGRALGENIANAFSKLANKASQAKARADKKAAKNGNAKAAVEATP